MTDFAGPKQPFQVVGDTVLSFKENEYTILNGLITTSDSSKPDYYLRARTIRIYSGDRIILSNVTAVRRSRTDFVVPLSLPVSQLTNSATISPQDTTPRGARIC